MRRIGFILLASFYFAALTARAAHTHVTLLLADDTVKPGDTVWAGLDLKMDPGWHTYWKNSGAAGLPTTVKWQLPPGITAGDVQWPLPKKLPPVEVTTYGYDDEVMLLVPLTIPANVSPGAVTLTANLAWLECMDSCIPGKTTVQATLNIGTETKASTDAATIDSWKNKVPGVDRSPATVSIWADSARWESPATNDTRSLVIDRKYLAQPRALVTYDSADFFPGASDSFEIQPATEVITANNQEIRLRKAVKKYSGDWPKEISGVIFGIKSHEEPQQAFEAHFSISDQSAGGSATQSQISTATGNTTAASVPAQPSETSGTKSLFGYLLSAFLGGLILNIMPCVLPVIALKILGFVGEARSEPRRVRNLGFIYALGVLASFSAIAAIVIGIKAAGHHAGWGLQFGNPIFVVGLTTLVLLIALNLFGVFEITPGGKLMNAAGDLASKHGPAGAFFNGLLATLLATPCTAPFMASALGFAFAQSAGVIFLILIFVGLGLAAPYVLLSCNPALLKFLPKPGAWMEKFKIIIGFPMLGTVVWLFSIAASDYGPRVWWLGIFLVIVALAAWIFGEFIQRGRGGKGVALAVIFILLIGGYAYALEDHLQWRQMTAEEGSNSLIDSSANGVTWQPWSPEAVAQARAAGKPVLVDFTATWCVTCNATVKPGLEYPSVVAKLKELNAVALLGDYTRTPQAMTDEISKYGGAGVPLVLVFPKNPDAPAIALRQPGPFEFPSSYSKAVLAALDKAD